MAGEYEITLRFDHWPDLFQTMKFIRNKDVRRNNQSNPFKGRCKVVLGDEITDMMPEGVLSINPKKKTFSFRKGGG